MAQGVHAAVKGVEAAGFDALRHRVSAETSGGELRARDHAVLSAGNGGDDGVYAGWTTFVTSWVTFVSHPSSVPTNSLRVCG